MLSQNDSACILLSGLWECAWITVCSILNHTHFSCRDRAAEFALYMSIIEKHDKALVAVHFTSSSSGACASSKCTSLVKNVVVDLASKSCMCLQGGTGNNPALVGVMSICLYVAQENESQWDCLGIFAMKILNYNYSNRHKNA